MSPTMTWKDALRRMTAKGQPYELAETQALGRTIRAFAHAPATVRDVVEQARSPKPFLVFGDERLTYEDVWRQSCRLAAAMAMEFGISKGDRVAISMRNYPEWVIAFNAATSLGAIAVAMNALWPPQELEYALLDSQPKLLLVDPERLEHLARLRVPQDLQVVAARFTGELPAGVWRYEDVMRDAGSALPPRVDIDPDDDAIMLYTSGSTGHAKGALSTHRNIVSALLSWELDTQTRILMGAIQAPAADAPQAAALLAIPLFHVSGLHHNLLSSYRAQRRLVLMYKWDPDLAVDLIERERITNFSAPSAVTADLVQAARRLNRPLNSLKTVGGGGAARAPDQVRAIDETFINAMPSTGWGMTETNSIGTGIGGAEYLRHPGSAGRVSGVLDVRVVDDDGQALPPMSRGELQIRGASIMRGYWNNPQANAEIFIDGWMRTGDVAYIDPDGLVYIVDRIKDLVIRGGENIGCGIVEAALLAHPQVIEACVYGVPDERLGEEVGATIYGRDGLDVTELRAFLAGRLARFEAPRYIHLAQAPLPRIASGKILKRQLRAEAIDRLAQPAA